MKVCLFPPRAAEMVAAKRDIRPFVTNERSGGLGPAQVKWCQDHIPNFAYCKAAADAAQEHARAVREKMKP